MVRDAGKHIRKPSLGINAVELCRLDQGIHNGGAVPAFVRTAKGPVAPANGNAADSTLGGVVGQADAGVLEKARECLPMIEGVADGLGKRPLGGELPALGAQPGLEAGNERL